jgi:hypothetical protein
MAVSTTSGPVSPFREGGHEVRQDYLQSFNASSRTRSEMGPVPGQRDQHEPRSTPMPLPNGNNVQTQSSPPSASPAPSGGPPQPALMEAAGPLPTGRR